MVEGPEGALTVEGITGAGTTEGDSMVQVRISETYDLSTKVNKMGIVGIHTPTGSLIDRLWPGLVLQHKKFRFVECDVAMACASMLPADPLQIGVEAGAIAPQDMFNPILYKAVSNDSMSNFLAYVQGFAESMSTATSNFVQGSVVDVNNADFQNSTPASIDQFDMYYGLLADPDGFRKAMPQAGLEMRGLYPLVYQVVSNYGGNQSSYVSGDFKYPDANSFLKDPSDNNTVQVPDVSETSTGTEGMKTWMFRGPSMRMPAIDCTCFAPNTGVDNRIVPASNIANINSNVGQVPPCYVGLIILPPAKLNQLYYRLKVTWTIEFTGIRPMSEINNWSFLSYLGQVSYGTDYADQSAAMSVQTSMVDGSETEITKIMEGV